MGVYTLDNEETLIYIQRKNQSDTILQELLIKQGVIPAQQGVTQIRDQRIEAQEMAQTPTVIDTMNMVTSFETANDKPMEWN